MAFVVVMPLAIWLAYRCRKRFEETQALSIFLSIMILVASGIVVSFRVGMMAVIVLNFVAAIGCVVGLIKDRRRMLDAVLTPGFCAYLVLGAIMFVGSYGRFLQFSDEFTYWARMIRNYYESGHFSFSLRYLEISSIWDYFSTSMWMRLSTGMMSLGHAMLVLAYLIPVYVECKREMRGRGTLRWLLVTAMIWMLPMFGAGIYHGYFSLLADMFLGAGVIYTMVMYIRYRENRDPFYLIAILVGVATVVLTKQAGMILGAILLFVMAGSSLASLRDKSRMQWLRCSICVMAVYLAAVLLANMMPVLTGGGNAYTEYLALAIHYWPVLVLVLVVVALWVVLFCRFGNRYWVTIPFVAMFVIGMLGITYVANPLDASGTVQVIYATLRTFLYSGASHVAYFCRLSDYMLVNLVFVLGALGEVLIRRRGQMQESMPAFLHVAVAVAADSLLLNIVYETELYGTLTWVLTVLLIAAEALVIVRYLHVRRKWFENTDYGMESYWLFYYLVIGCGLYLLFYCSGMILAYGEPVYGDTAGTARSLWRYLYSYMAPLIFLMGYVLLRKWEEVFGIGCNPFWYIFLLILLDADLAAGVAQIYDRPQEIDFHGMEGITLETDASVCYVDMNLDNETMSWVEYYYRFITAPDAYIGTSVRTDNWFVDSLYGTRETPEEVADELVENENTYVYLRYIDVERGFADYYAELFEDPEEISSDRLYRVEETDDGSVTLVYVPRNTE